MKHPIDTVHWVDRDCVRPNDYNPNSQLAEAMNLLVDSIRADGWTQPIVVRPKENGIHRIIDGEHRWRASQVVGGKIPVVILDRDKSGCISATVRHNRARGSHGVDGMVMLIKQLREEGLSDEEIEQAMGLYSEERKRLEVSEERFLHIMAGRDMVMET